MPRLLSTAVVLALIEAHAPESSLYELAHRIEAAGELDFNAAQRAVYRLCERPGVTHLTVDRILTALDLHHLWHTEPELADAAR